MSERSEVKAREYLVAGHVKVIEHDENSALITVQGSAKEPYNVIYGNAVWHCSCPARKPLCAHVVAAKLISPLRTEVKGLAPLKDPAIDDILGDLGAVKAAKLSQTAKLLTGGPMLLPTAELLAEGDLSFLDDL